MKRYKILCYKSEFYEFKRKSNDYIREMPAKEHDQFALLMAISPEGAVGFDTTPQGCSAISALASKCYFVDLRRPSIQPPQEKHTGLVPSFLFRDKSGEFEKLFDEHIKYENDIKKYKILSRHRYAEKPSASTLASLLQSNSLSITKDVYDALQEACHYIIRPVMSGEHGRGAFNIFSNNLDFFFDEFKSIVGDSGEVTFVDASKLVYD
ncbi:hypothetical protein [Pseudomonas purpurea]|uniref:hypothetical protein n=1 Tax=Pseudomonas purpurea TaxID=3136737 RepID=UPI0032646288